MRRRVQPARPRAKPSCKFNTHLCRLRSGRREHSEFFFTFTSFTEPGAIYRCDVSAGPAAAPPPALFRRIRLQGDFGPDAFVTEQVGVSGSGLHPAAW